MRDSITATNLEVVYPGGTRALKGVSFSVPRATVIGYLGANGAGKTTTVNVLTTAMPPTKGQAKVCGFDIHNQKDEIRQRIGVATQDPIVDPFISPYENMRLFATVVGVARTKREQRIKVLLEDFELAAKARDRVLTLSGGQWKRLQIAISMLREPELLFLDEPTLGLDPLGKQTLFSYLQTLVESGTTIFFSSNEMEQLERVCDRVIFLSQGRVLAEGLVGDFVRRFAGGEIVRVHYNGPLPDGLVDALSSAHDMQFQDVSPLSWVSDNLEDLLPFVLSELLAHGVQIRNVEIHAPTLNDAFLAIMKEKANGEN